MENKPDTKPSHPQRKKPAHRSPVERHNEPVILFVTLTVQPRGDFLANRAFLDAFLEACVDADAWHVGYYLIMPDHVHFFCSPAKWPRVELMRWVRFLKERITKRLGTASPSRCVDEHDLPHGGRTCGEPGVAEAARVSRVRLGTASPSRWEDVRDLQNGGRTCGEPCVAKAWRWQSDCWDTQIRSGEHYHDKWEYVRQNPVRKKMVTQPKDWPWQGVLHELRW